LLFGLLAALTSRSTGRQLHSLVAKKGDPVEPYQRLFMTAGILMALLGFLGLVGLVRFGGGG
jgi:hypothetical protein